MVNRSDTATPPEISSQHQAKRRKRATRVLNPDQLARKRQNDRDAQRAIRQRTKQSIETLEKRVEELESGEEFVHLQDVISERDALRNENDTLKRRLSSVLQIVRHEDDEHDDLNLGKGNEGHARSHWQLDTIASVSASSDKAFTISNPTSSASTVPASPYPVSAPGSARRLSSNNIFAYQPNSYNVNNNDGSEVVYSGYCSTPLSEHPDFIGPTQPKFMRFPSNVPPTCSFDQIFIEFINASRSQIASGIPANHLLGPAYPEISTLVKPEAAEDPRYHNLSKLIADSLEGFGDIYELPTKAALLANNFWLIKWMVQPSEESYNSIPLHSRPTEEQIAIPHPFWMDLIQWPFLRIRLVHSHTNIGFGEFFFPWYKSIELDWPGTGDLDECAYTVTRTGQSPSGPRCEPDGYMQDILIKPELLEHAQNINNWSVSAAFVDVFPWVVDLVRVRL